MRPRVMQACHSTVSCHLGTARTLRVLERFYWWIGVSICTRWWLRNCLKCQARKTLRQMVRWPTITLPFPEASGIAVSIDYTGPLPVTPSFLVFIFSLFHETSSPSPPLGMEWRRPPLTILPFPIGKAFLSLSLSRFFTYLVGFVASPFRGVGVGFEEPHLRLMLWFVESGFP